MFTVAVVKLDTVTLLTVMPAPKLANVVVGVLTVSKCVLIPVTATLRVCACCPKLGEMEPKDNPGPVETMKPEVIVATSVPLVTVMERAPGKALLAIVNVAVKDVVEV